ncbi:MAG: glycoside hydrolase/phage tail family protein [Alphaproteobacteria bacterium]|nr:glycoside hydrolase/phage tail family protein [Alphaproteobacteria bacterium]MDE2629590.1 glycoside hydrolase/phage tail family protein [Alphaproteobacteria bacterium]
MASLVLGVVGSALGPSLFGGGVSFLGAAVTGAQIGGALGALAGGEIDAALMPAVKRTGARLSDIAVQSSTEGAPIPHLYGRMRAAGQLLWASRFKETTSTATTGGKGAAPAVKTTDYLYSISFAVGLCAGPVTRIGRVWADGNLIDLAQYTVRFYPGDEAQSFDPLIEEIEGAGNTPAYRGLCVVVFEDLPLAQFGNRIPQLQFEIVRAISSDNPASLENLLPGVALIPGAGEFVYATGIVSEDDGEGATAPENAHGASGEADLKASLDELQDLAAHLGAVSLVVGWFGDDLRAGTVRIKPGVETAAKLTYPETWSVDGVARADAHVVSQSGGRPAYGGTPSDLSVVAAIAELKARGLSVLFNPFLFLDVAAANALPNPYTDNAAGLGQPPYPWRGRITVSPACGYAGSADQTSAAAAQISAFFGTATAADFSVSGTAVSWTGGSDWGYRRMILHYAKLCAAAGGVDAFLIGSELRALTRSRSDASTYPAVAALKTLAADVRAILPGAKIGYAADWSEYNNHQTGDVPGALIFNLDPLWSDANIDFVGIDNYLPLADWRDGTAHLDYNANGPTSIHDPAYLASNIKGGEDYDWYYADAAAREAQTRTTIADGPGKPWVWRAKDLWGWWSNLHYDRPAGSESATHTAWAAQSKPIWFTELGCPAVEKGANQPNVFFDPKSSESFFPYYSNGQRDDLVQRRFLEAHLNFWKAPANNPASGVYSGRMVDTANVYAWCWDARPFPFFPARADVWGDAANYRTGHWLNGRLGAVQLCDLAGALCAEADFSAIDVSNLDGIVTGFALADTVSVREALAPLSAAYFFDAVESDGLIKFVRRGRPAATPFGEGDVALGENDSSFGFTLARSQETDLPNVSRLSYFDADADYRKAVVEARRLVTLSDRVAASALPLVLDQGQAVGIGQVLLQDAWVMRESATFALAPSQIALDPCDEVLLDAGGRPRRLRLTGIDDGGARKIEAVATDPSIYETVVGAARATAAVPATRQPGRALVVFLDLPLLCDDQNPNAPFAAAYADPWPGAVQILRSPTDSNYTLDTALTRPAALGSTTQDFYSGPLWRWDLVNSLCVKLYNGILSSADELSVRRGANTLAVQNAGGDWEIVQFAAAALTAPGQWTLTKLLRGQRGTEGAMRNPVAAGARVVVLDGALRQLALTQNQARAPFNYLWGPQGKPISDPSYQSGTFQFGAVGLRPFSPSHIGFAWAANGDLTILWNRRDRSPTADSWNQVEVAMSETSEAYDLEIMDGAAVARTFSAVPRQSQIYTLAEQTADFPSGLPNPLVVHLYQLSSVLGRGQQKTESLYVR